MAIRKPRFSLFSKFTLGISITVAVFGALNIIIVNNSVTRSLMDEFDKRGYFITRTLAEQAVGYILADNPAGLNLLVNEIKGIDPSIHYVFILNEHSEVIAHTFNRGVPPGLLSINRLPPEEAYRSALITDIDNVDLLIKDFAMPALSPTIGTVRVGILESEIRKQVISTLNILWLMVGIFLLLGAFGALFFSHTISVPLRMLSQQSEIIDIRNIQSGIDRIRESTGNFYFRVRRVFNRDDEIDILYENYLNMLKRLEQTHHELNNLQQLLLQTEKMASIGTLTAGIAHEINNPLAGMSISLKRISKQPGNQEQIRKYTILMQEALGKIENVIQDLLTYSRKSHLVFEKINICDIIRKSVKLAQYRLKGNNIDITIDSSGCPLVVFVSTNRIEQVFFNMIINAIDAILEKMDSSPGMDGKIDIKLDEDKMYNMVSISDNGTGMDKEMLSKVFDPFFTTKQPGKGTGLGLSVSYQIIKDHGGEIRVESSRTAGTTFSILLPKHKDITDIHHEAQV
jgi:two-component system, NtrC family, sensor kinase